MLSSSSGKTQISINIQTMIRFTCSNCHHRNSASRPLRFSRRNSILNSIQCAKCHALQVQVGGPRSPPTTRRQTVYSGHGSDEAESSTYPGRPYNAAREKFKPIVSSALASSTHVARSFAISEADGEDQTGVEVIDHDPDTLMTGANAVDHGGSSVPATTSDQRLTRLRKRRKATIFLNQRVKQVMDMLPHGLRTKLSPMTAPLDRLASQSDAGPSAKNKDKGKQPVQARVPPLTPTAISIPHKRPSLIRFASPPPSIGSSPSSSSRKCQHCAGIEECTCSPNPSHRRYSAIIRHPINALERMMQRNHAAVSPERSEVSTASPPRRPESTNVSQILLDLVRPNRFSRDSTASSSARYASHLSIGPTGTERSASRPAAGEGLSSPEMPQFSTPTLVVDEHDIRDGRVRDSAVFVETTAGGQQEEDPPIANV